MAQVGAAWDYSQPHFCGYSLKASQRDTNALVLRITRPFSDVKPMDEERLANVCGIVFPIEAPVAQQHVEAVDAARQEADRAARARRVSGAFSDGSFDFRSGGRHSAPTFPPTVSGIEALDQHRAGLTFDSHPRFSVHCGEGEACGKERIRTRLVSPG